jgi:beta-aspartyl-peptidase (threonine type)
MKKVRAVPGTLLLLAIIWSVSSVFAPVRAYAYAEINDASGAVSTNVNKRKATPNPEATIRADLDAQVAAWNRGDLKGYMNGYWHSPELTFFAGTDESEGWDAAYQRYHAVYSGKSKEMGKLKFVNLRVEMLGPEAGFVRGGWQLTMKDGSQRKGLFTIVLKKIGTNWRIIHDHSS